MKNAIISDEESVNELIKELETIKTKPTPPYIINKAVENIDDEYLNTPLIINWTPKVQFTNLTIYEVGTYNKENNTLELMNGLPTIEEEDMYKTYDMVKNGIVNTISQKVLNYYLIDQQEVPVCSMDTMADKNSVSIETLSPDRVYLCVFHGIFVEDYIMTESTEIGDIICTLGRANEYDYKFSTILMCPALDKATEITISEPIIGKELRKCAVEVVTTVLENTISENKNFKYRIEAVSERKNNYV